MQISVRTVAIITLSLIIISGLAMVSYSLFGDAGEDVEETGNKAGDGIDCVLDDMENADECKEKLKDSSWEVQPDEKIPI